MCGRLQSGTQAERPIFGDPTTVSSAYTYVRVGSESHQCHVIRTTYVVVQKNRPDPDMVLDGSQCGDDKICVNAKCKPLSEVYKTVSKCNDQCHYRGVCNNVGNCIVKMVLVVLLVRFRILVDLLTVTRPTLVYYPFNDSVGAFRYFLCRIRSGWYVLLVQRRRNLPGEFWQYARKTLNLHGALVPVRKASPPPGGRRQLKM
ncbi:hypothetical protein KIN20_017950 [Parelaphostrongylus tenuis]|nr:hypothetical protein KIN20_017948 [Parelaphostrongylus tenuis]KAJ1359258.1 hypothetical protein KIN20_017950 [Parelaphostrongylus tenuis]